MRSKIREKGRHLSLRNIQLIAVIIVVFFLGALMVHSCTKPNLKNIKIDGFVLMPAQEMNDFHLSATDGNAFTKDSLKGHWTLLFFGFTNCASVCPTTMAELNKMIQVLQTDMPKKVPQVVLVSVDPERDSIARMKDYVVSYNPSFIGARADLAETQALEKQLHIVAGKMSTGGWGINHYTVNHSAEVMLFNPEGKLQAYLSYPHTASVMVDDYKKIVSAS